MNNKIYRLLRNNKEQGPFSSEELIAKGLKPYDLIWADGRSAAWSYPGEMSEFKSYVPAPEDHRNNLIVTKQENISRVSNAVQAAVAVNNNLVQSGIKQKPRYKVSAAWSKIQTITTPSYSDVIVAEPRKASSAKIINTSKTQPVNAKSLSWEQAWRDWENEKKTVTPVKTKPALVPSPVKKAINETARTAPALEKKFEQSLDTITDKYIDNLLLQKKKSRGFSLGKSSEFILPSLALIVIFSIGYWLLHDNKTASAISSPAKQTVSVNKNEQPANNINSVAVNDNKKTATQIPQQTENNKGISDEPVAKTAVKERVSEPYSKNAKFISSVKTNNSLNNIANNKNVQANSSDINLKKITASNNKQFDPSVINNIPADNSYNDPVANNNGDLNAAENRPVRRRTNNSDINNQSTNNSDNAGTTKTAKPKSGLSYVSVPEYVTMNNGNGSIKIQNTSDVDLDLVVVDVQYYDASSRYRKGETLYLHNLRAGKTVTVKTPRDVNSAYATSKVSLVSSDANGVYAVGDN
ncbi:MAG TPA: hypothetical protein VEV62_05530 [Parafilimonas sp.]|nr:hypothetical protein [Parafilimonas sp.]